MSFSRTLAGVALLGLALQMVHGTPAGAQSTMPAAGTPTPAPVGSPSPGAMVTPPPPSVLPSPIVNLPPASQPVTLPYPAYGTPAPGVNRGVPSATIPTVISLDQAIAIGFAKSPSLAAARAVVEIDTAPVALAQTAILPNIAGTAAASRNYFQYGTLRSGSAVGGGANSSPVVNDRSLEATLTQ